MSNIGDFFVAEGPGTQCRCPHWPGDVEPELLQFAESPEAFLQLCPPQTAEAATFSSAMVPASWAEALLEQQPGLKLTRFRLVPGKVSEDDFWDRYFAAIFRRLEAELSRSEVTKGSAASTEAKYVDAMHDVMESMWNDTCMNLYVLR